MLRFEKQHYLQVRTLTPEHQALMQNGYDRIALEHEKGEREHSEAGAAAQRWALEKKLVKVCLNLYFICHVKNSCSA